MTSGTRFTRLHPAPGPVELRDLLGALVLPSHDDRPAVLVSMAATADGRAVVQGGSELIGSGADTEHVSELRVVVDAILVAPGTMRAERYRRPVRREDRLARRGGRSPLVATVTRSGDVPWDVPLFADPEARVLVFGAAEPPAGLRAQVELRPETDPAAVLRALHDAGVRAVLGEGGPSFNHALFAAGLVDELYLTVAPLIAGGAEAPTIVQGPPLPDRRRMDLVWVLAADGDLFLRYRIRPSC